MHHNQWCAIPAKVNSNSIPIPGKALRFNSDSNSTLEYISSIQFRFPFHPWKYELNLIPIPIPRNLDSNSNSASTHRNHTSMMSTPFARIRILFMNASSLNLNSNLTHPWWYCNNFMLLYHKVHYDRCLPCLAIWQDLNDAYYSNYTMYTGQVLRRGKCNQVNRRIIILGYMTKKKKKKRLTQVQTFASYLHCWHLLI